MCLTSTSTAYPFRSNLRDEGSNQSHAKRMPDSDRRQSVPDRRTPVFLQPERNRKEPGRSQDSCHGRRRAQAAPATAMLHSRIAERVGGRVAPSSRI